jgi:hypothetical protein
MQSTQLRKEERDLTEREKKKEKEKEIKKRKRERKECVS